MQLRISESVLQAILLLILVLVASTLPLSSHAREEQSTPKLKDVFSETEETEDTAQSSSNAKTEQKKLVKVGPDDDYDRGVPRTSVAGYFKALKNNDLERAAQYLDLRNLPKGYSYKDGPELARQLQVVLDRSLWVEMDLLSTDPEGHSDDGLPSYRDLLGQIEINGKNMTFCISVSHAVTGFAYGNFHPKR